MPKPPRLIQKFPGLENLVVTLRAKDDAEMAVQGWLGPDGFKVTQGYAGLVEVPRPRRVSMVHYQGSPPIHMSGEIVLDTWTWIPEESVDGDFLMLEQMAGLDPKHVQPYVLNIVGKAIPHQDIPWYIWNLTWGDALRNTEGQLKRQRVTIELVEAVTPDYVRPIEDTPNVEQPSAGHGVLIRTPKNKKLLGYWITKKGDTLQYIAKKCYGQAKLKWWKRIAAANGLANPARVPVGIKLKIPRIQATGNPYAVNESASQRGR